MNNELLPISLNAAVLLWILSLKEKGGPTDGDWAWLKEARDILGETGEAILFPVKKKGETDRVFNAVAKAIAILSFVPCGIEIFGHHWESKKGTKKP